MAAQLPWTRLIKMDYLSVTQSAFLTSLVMTTALFAILSFNAFEQPWKRLLLVGVSGQLIWNATLFYSYNISQLSANVLLNAELLRFFFWLVALTLLILKRTQVTQLPLTLKFLLLFSVGLLVYAYYVIHIQPTSSAVQVSSALLFLAITCLIYTEQVLRNLNMHRMIKLLALCLTFSFALDITIYGQNLLTGSIQSILRQARAGLSFTVALTLSVGTLLFNEPEDSKYIFTVSRPAAFYTTAMFLSFLLAATVILGNHYINQQSYLGSYLFTLALLGSSFLLLSLIISKQFRQHFEVFISKHFFALKYDYRTEWLSAIRGLSDLRSNQELYYDKILAILIKAIRADTGSLWISNGSELKELSKTLDIDNSPDAIPVNEHFIRTMLKESWIYVPNSLNTSLAEHNSLLPNWIKSNENIWMVTPLIIQMKLVGFAILGRPRVKSAITYEDRDLMTNLSTQVASQILLHQQEKLISDSKQLETYNRLSSFIMHDTNNVIAQLGLVVKNAEKHKHNPAFIDDMVKTVQNAVGRMQSLIQKFNPASKEKRTDFLISEVLTELVEICSVYEPKPGLQISSDFSIYADKERFLLALKNLVRNAQESTGNNGKVKVHAIDGPNGREVIVEDNGSGMTQSFINEELFRPFSTTKLDNGVGIGAYLTQSYLEHLGAVLNVKSEIDQGSRFEIRFN